MEVRTIKAKVTRPSSPTKQQQPPRVRATPSASTSRASSTVGRTPRAPQPPSAPPTPSRAHVTVPGLHHAASFSSRPTPQPQPQPRLVASRSVIGLTDRASPTPPRIRAKLSSVATTSSSTSTSPVVPSFPRVRAPPSPPPPLLYPITTAVPAANPHRFAQARPISRQGSSTPTPRTSPVVPNHANFQAFRTSTPPRLRPDPAALALPNSPPASTLSVSSRSSASAREAHSRTPSTVDTDAPPPPDPQQPAASSAEDSPARDGDRKVKAAAKSDRKIADLEITTRSLLAINATLEANALRQARELRALRRRLRQTRLALPPRAFRAAVDADRAAGLDVLSADDEDEDDDDSAALDGVSVSEALSDSDRDDDDDDDDADDATPGGAAAAGDAAFRRVRALLDALLADGRAALACVAPAPTKVLSPDEMRAYHRDAESPPADDSRADTSFDYSETGDDTAHDDDSMDPTTSEDEVVALVVRESPPPPPILITSPGD